jgi:tetratricopeptide (TPR) repeat protein
VIVGCLPVLPQAGKPDDPLLLLRTAQEYSKAGRDTDAIETLSRLIDACRNQPQARVFLPEALKLMEVVHRRDPKSFGSTFLLAELLFLTNQYSQSLALLATIGPRATANADFFNLAGMCFAGLNDLPKASQAVLKAIELAPDRVDFLVNLAGLYQRARNHDAALRALEKAVRMPSASPEAFFGLALTRYNLGEFQSAITNCQRTIELNPQFDKAFLLMGRAYSKMSKPSEAVQALEKAQALNPACDQCRLDLAILLAAAGDTARSTRLLRELVATDSRSAGAHYQLGKILSQQGNVNEAISELERALALDQEHDGARYQLAALYRKQGQTEKAVEVLSTLRKRKENRRNQSEENLLRKAEESRER